MPEAKSRKKVFEQDGFFCNVNRVEDEGEGGVVSLVIDPPHAPDDSFFEDKKMTGATLTLNHRKDEPMRAWPVTLAEKQGKRYQVVVYEYDAPAK
ncbi:MAG: hypothetical protein WEA80_01910 [Gemmatimonadaceae bacterium]